MRALVGPALGCSFLTGPYIRLYYPGMLFPTVPELHVSSRKGDQAVEGTSKATSVIDTSLDP